MKYALFISGFLIFFSLSKTGFGQEREVDIIGRVSDVENNAPLSGVSIYNLRRDKLTISNEKGDYSISAHDFDRIVFSSVGYFSDTVRINGLYKRQKIDVQLRKNKYSFAPVEIFGKRPDYGADSIERRQWFSGALNETKTHGLDAISHPISALYDAISGRQKRLWRFQKDFEEHEQQKYIRSRVNPQQIEDLFHLEGDSLKAFILWYNPGYYFVRGSTDYELLEDIKQAVSKFRAVYVMPDNMDFKNQNFW